MATNVIPQHLDPDFDRFKGDNIVVEEASDGVSQKVDQHIIDTHNQVIPRVRNFREWLREINTFHQFGKVNLDALGNRDLLKQIYNPPPAALVEQARVFIQLQQNAYFQAKVS